MFRIASLAVLRRLAGSLVSLGLAVTFGAAAMPAQAGPYTLCASLLNASHMFPKSPLRTLESGCAGMDPYTDPGSISVTLSSTDFGDFTGTATASSDAFDKVRLFAQVDLQNYRAGSYVVETPGGGIPFAASAFATYQDYVTVSGPSGLGVMELTFGVTGETLWNGIAGQLCYGFAVGGPMGGGSCWTQQVLPSSVTLRSGAFALNTPQALQFEFSAVVFVSDQNFSNPYNASATVDLANTLVMQEMRVLTPGGLPIAGISVASDGEFPYPLSAANQAPPVPEPATWATLAAGLAVVLLGRRTRARRRHPGHG